MHKILIFAYQGAEVVRMYKTLLGSQGFRKVENDPNWFLCDNQLYHKSVHPGKFNHNCFLYFRAWIFILKDMMVKLWHVKIFLLPCETQMMQILRISYNGIDLSFIFFELPSFFMLTLECNKITGTPKLVHLWWKLLHLMMLKLILSP